MGERVEARFRGLFPDERLVAVADSRHGLGRFPPLVFKMNAAEFAVLTGARPGAAESEIMAGAERLAQGSEVELPRRIAAAWIHTGKIAPIAESAAPALENRDPILESAPPAAATVRRRQKVSE